MSTNQHFDYGPLHEHEIDAFSALVTQALVFHPPEMTRPWMLRLGQQHFRAVRSGGRLVAGLGIIPMGQWFGGVSVPTGGVTAVGVAPEARGGGLGLQMMRQMLEELHAQGTPLSSLYPATTTFYRRAGYERAATRTIYEFWPDRINMRDYKLDVTAVTPEDEAELRRIYTERAKHSAGMLDRHASLWQGLHHPTSQSIYRYLVRRDGCGEGYIAFSQGRRDEPIRVTDICALTADAGRRLLTLLADQRTMIEKITWSGAPNDPLLFLMPEQRYTIDWQLDLMLRIVDVVGALEARGYPAGVRASVQLEVQDALLPWNNGRFVLEVADGRAQVRAGGTGDIRLHVRDLAALYSGYMTPQELQVAGTLAGPEAALTQMAAVFAGPRPWTPDMF